MEMYKDEKIKEKIDDLVRCITASVQRNVQMGKFPFSLPENILIIICSSLPFMLFTTNCMERIGVPAHSHAVSFFKNAHLNVVAMLQEIKFEVM